MKKGESTYHSRTEKVEIILQNAEKTDGETCNGNEIDFSHRDEWIHQGVR